MTKKMYQNWKNFYSRMEAYGINTQDADMLRRIEMTLSRWAEMECGDSNGNGIERDEVTQKPYMTFDPGVGKRKRYAIPDREAGAKKRLYVIMQRYPELVAYNQSDCRGCSLYIVRKSDIKDGDIDSLYTRGIAVCL